MARLHEQAARTGFSNVDPDARLERCAEHLRETAYLIERTNPQPTIDVTKSVPQKIKLLNFLRQQGLSN